MRACTISEGLFLDDGHGARNIRAVLVPSLCEHSSDFNLLLLRRTAQLGQHSTEVERGWTCLNNRAEVCTVDSLSPEHAVQGCQASPSTPKDQAPVSGSLPYTRLLAPSALFPKQAATMHNKVSSARSSSVSISNRRSSMVVLLMLVVMKPCLGSG